MKAAIIGCGNIGSSYSDLVRSPGVYSHAHAYTEHPESELVAVVDPDLKKAQDCAKRWGVPGVFADHREMLEQAQPEVVSICSPNATHVAIGLDVLKHPSVRGVLCEKPLALDLDSARALVEAATLSRKPLLVNYSRRFGREYQELRSQLHAGSFGKLQAVTGLYGKGLFHNGTHWLDLVRLLVGEPIWVSAHASGFAFGQDDTFSLSLGFEDGLNATLHGTDHKALTVFEMDIVGTAGRVLLGNGGRTIDYYDVVASDFIAGARTLRATPSASVTALEHALPTAVANLIDCIHERSEPLCTGADGIATLTLAEAARSSARSGQRVLL